MRNGLTPKQQGDRGEASALEWLVHQGAEVFFPLTSSPDVDLVALFGHELVRVQVKTTNYERNGRWCIALCTRGGNQSWSGLVKRFSPERCDALFAVVGDGRRWYIPAEAVEAANGILLGGPKYARFEVEPGQALKAPGEGSSLHFPAARRDTEAVKRVRL